MKEVTLYNSIINQNKITLIILLLISLIIFSGCGKEATNQLSAEELFRLGMKAFNDEDYLDAIEEFKLVTLQYQGSKVADSAQFYMAECRFLRDEYILASYEYELLIRNMSSSALVSQARFKLATCYYNMSPDSHHDQKFSNKAIDEYQGFIEYHPKDSLVAVAEERIRELNTKLAKKDFDNGIIYFKMNYYKAATYYFDLILEKYHDTQYAEPALFKKAESLLLRKKYYEAKEAVEKFIAKYPQSKMFADAVILKKDIEIGLAEEINKANKEQEAKRNNEATQN